ncbi:MAG: signal peptide peptidase SppA [Candidatus Fermentibacteraceae bacterium]|nr:signal peptide peptidase SppA [Candidatus Fermentibacteraceae bacterium]MBN2608375.1 signal peptide peptidase SppA [Candidatus Fermentibacteraceae bacterium]
MRVFLFPAAILLLSSLVGAYVTPGPAPVFDWVAYPEAGNPEIINPAGFSFIRTLQLRFGYAVSDSSFEGFDRVSLSIPGMGLSGWWDDGLDMRKFTLSSGFDIFDETAFLGIGYTWFDPTVRDNVFAGKDLFTVGLIVRPNDWFSLGMVRRGGVELDGGDDVEPSYRAGLGLRPFGSCLTITADVETGGDLEDYSLSAGAEFRPMEGLAFRAGVGEDRLSLGLSAGLGNAAISYGAESDDEYGYDSSRGEVILLSSPGEDMLAPRGIFVRFEAGEFDELRQRSFLGPVRSSFTETALLLLGIADDNSVSGVIVDIDDSGIRPAVAEELRYILQRIRDTGKKVYFYIREGSSDEYYLASMGDGIWIHPAGDIAFLGVASQSFYLRDFLDMIGIYPDLMHIGEYKSASDMLTRSDMSDSERRATTELLESFQEELVRGISSGRGLEPAQIREIMESGIYTPQRALAAGMVDGVCYGDQVSDEIGGDIAVLTLEEYSNSIPPSDNWGPRGHIAVVTATGFINRGESGSVFPIGRVMGSGTICDALREAASQPGVRAIILRIDSGGGDALASADMHHAVEQVREDIPVIVSMGGVAASGGYYMACGADRIFADRMTVTGSIGIISGKFVFGDMLDSLGINTEEISIGPMASIGSPFRRFSDSERGRMFQLMSDSYDLFVRTVAEGREMTFEEVDSIGRGRVWSGSDALEIGIVDEIGGVAQAVMYAARITGMDDGEMPEVRIYPTPEFPGSLDVPGFGAAADILEFLGEEKLLYLMQPLILD